MQNAQFPPPQSQGLHPQGPLRKDPLRTTARTGESIGRTSQGVNRSLGEYILSTTSATAKVAVDAAKNNPFTTAALVGAIICGGPFVPLATNALAQQAVTFGTKTFINPSVESLPEGQIKAATKLAITAMSAGAVPLLTGSSVQSAAFSAVMATGAAIWRSSSAQMPQQPQNTTLTPQEAAYIQNTMTMLADTIQQNPEDETSRSSLSNLYELSNLPSLALLSAGKKTEATKTLWESVRAAPPSTEGKTTAKATLFFAEGDYKIAQALLAEKTNEDPGDGDVGRFIQAGSAYKLAESEAERAAARQTLELLFVEMSERADHGAKIIALEIQTFLRGNL